VNGKEKNIHLPMTTYGGQLARIEGKIDSLTRLVADVSNYVRTSQQENRDEINKLCIGLSKVFSEFGEIQPLPDLPPAPVPPPLLRGLSSTSTVSDDAPASKPKVELDRQGSRLNSARSPPQRL
jgi:hypothetical protein